MKTVEMPKMGDTMEEGKILRWIKHEGDQVKKGESLAEVETDKVNIEIESFASGVLRKILVPEGNSAPIGAGIALIGAADEALPAELAGNGAAGKKPETRVKEGNGTGYAAQTAAQQASVQVAPAAPHAAWPKRINWIISRSRVLGPMGASLKWMSKRPWRKGRRK